MDKTKIVLRCPDCGASKSRITTSKKGVSRCLACGKEGLREIFIEK